MFLIVLFFTFAETKVFSSEFPYLYRPPQFLSHGNAGLAWVEGGESMYYNPAGLGRGKQIFQGLQLFAPYIELSSDLKNVLREVLLQEEAPLEVLGRHIGKVEHLGFGQAQYFALKKVALGLAQKSSNHVFLGKDPRDGGFETVMASTVNDLVLTFGLANDFWDERVFVGIMGKHVSRVQGGIHIQVDDNAKALDPESFTMSGYAMGADLGVQIRSRHRYPLFLGLVLQDVGDSLFTPFFRTSLPRKDWPLEDLKQVLNLGVGWQGGTSLSRLKLALDFKDALRRYPYHWVHRTALGADLSLGDRLGLGMGLHQGYPTMGCYLSLPFIRVDLGFYSQEIDPDYPSLRGDSRYYASLRLGF